MSTQCYIPLIAIVSLCYIFLFLVDCYRHLIMSSLISWNVNSIFSKYPFVQLLLKDFNPSVFCIQETKLLPSHSIFLRNYYIYRNDNLTPGNAKGGVLIAVSKQLHVEHITLNSPFQAVAARIWFDTPITICSLYLHHQDHVTLDLLQDLIKQLPPPFILTGYFNAHYELWGSTNTDSCGAIDEHLLYSPHISLLNTGQHTRFDIYSGNYSAIDLTLCISSLVPHLQWSMLGQLYTSDQFPQRIEIAMNTIQPTFIPSQKFQDADWETFAQLVDLSGLETCANATEMATLIEKNILLAAEETISHITPPKGKYRVPWWDDNCAAAIKKKRNSWRIYKRYPTDENLLNFKKA